MSPYESLLVKDESEQVSMSHHAPGAYMSQNESATSNQPIVTLPPPLRLIVLDQTYSNSSLSSTMMGVGGRAWRSRGLTVAGGSAATGGGR